MMARTIQWTTIALWVTAGVISPACGPMATQESQVAYEECDKGCVSIPDPNPDRKPSPGPVKPGAPNTPPGSDGKGDGGTGSDRLPEAERTWLDRVLDGEIAVGQEFQVHESTVKILDTDPDPLLEITQTEKKANGEPRTHTTQVRASELVRQINEELARQAENQPEGGEASAGDGEATPGAGGSEAKPSLPGETPQEPSTPGETSPGDGSTKAPGERGRDGEGSAQRDGAPKERRGAPLHEKTWGAISEAVGASIGMLGAVGGSPRDRESRRFNQARAFFAHVQLAVTELGAEIGRDIQALKSFSMHQRESILPAGAGATAAQDAARAFAASAGHLVRALEGPASAGLPGQGSPGSGGDRVERPESIEIDSAHAYARFAQRRLSADDGKHDGRTRLVAAAVVAIEDAEKSFRRGDPRRGSDLLTLAQGLVDLALNSSPGAPKVTKVVGALSQDLTNPGQTPADALAAAAEVVEVALSLIPPAGTASQPRQAGAGGGAGSAPGSSALQTSSDDLRAHTLGLANIAAQRGDATARDAAIAIADLAAAAKADGGAATGPAIDMASLIGTYSPQTKSPTPRQPHASTQAAARVVQHVVQNLPPGASAPGAHPESAIDALRDKVAKVGQVLASALQGSPDGAQAAATAAFGLANALSTATRAVPAVLEVALGFLARSAVLTNPFAIGAAVAAIAAATMVELPLIVHQVPADDAAMPAPVPAHALSAPKEPAREWSPEEVAKDKQYAEMPRKERTRLANAGDKYATREKNRRYAESARANGNPDNAVGPETEIRAAESMWDDVVKAGEKVKVKIDGKLVDYDIDIETPTEVIEVKGGGNVRSDEQLKKLIQAASDKNKSPGLIYDSTKFAGEALENLKKQYPFINIRPIPVK